MLQSLAVVPSFPAIEAMRHETALTASVAIGSTPTNLIVPSAGVRIVGIPTLARPTAECCPGRLL
jgi:hypothetical protein